MKRYLFWICFVLLIPIASTARAQLDSSCVSCHQNDYNGTANPNHVSAGFPLQCELCHSTTQYAGATFNHSQTAFPLTGTHVSVQCANCHINNRYAGTPTNCYDCHQTEYNTVTNPNHQAAGFPTNCQSCHNSVTWTGATFNHSFPIYSGAHRGEWNTCTDCHVNTNNYSVFMCLNCHEHRQSSMDDHHSGERNYVYDSLNCYACHPDGSH